MKTLILISFLIIGHSSFGQSKVEAVDSNYGVSLKKADSTELNNIVVINFQSSKTVIFPPDYANKLLGRSDQYKNVTFIKPDTNLVKAALSQLEQQYCNSLLRFNKRNWEKTIDIHKEDGLRKDLKKIRNQQREQLNRHNKFCPTQQTQIQFKDKQVIAYKRPSGDTILYIQTLDFRQDPYKLQPHFMTSWIDGWHGWFETNTMRFHYHTDKKLLTINEEF